MTALPASLRTFLEVFSSSLSEVRFADIDARTLEASAAEVEAAAERLAEIQSSLEVARAELTEKTDAFVQLSQRALAYARIYAEGNAELSAQLEALALPKANRRTKTEDAKSSSGEGASSPPERGRPRKRAEATSAPATSEAAPPSAEEDPESAERTSSTTQYEVESSLAVETSVDEVDREVSAELELELDGDAGATNSRHSANSASQRASKAGSGSNGRKARRGAGSSEERA